MPSPPHTPMLTEEEESIKNGDGSDLSQLSTSMVPVKQEKKPEDPPGSILNPVTGLLMEWNYPNESEKGVKFQPNKTSVKPAKDGSPRLKNSEIANNDSLRHGHSQKNEWNGLIEKYEASKNINNTTQFRTKKVIIVHDGILEEFSLIQGKDNGSNVQVRSEELSKTSKERQLPTKDTKTAESAAPGQKDPQKLEYKDSFLATLENQELEHKDSPCRDKQELEHKDSPCIVKQELEQTDSPLTESQELEQTDSFLKVEEQHDSKLPTEADPQNLTNHKLQSQTVMNASARGAPPKLCADCLEGINQIHNLNLKTNEPLGDKTPYVKRHGMTPELSAYILYTFWSKILYLETGNSYPDSKELPRQFVEIAKNVGDVLAFIILHTQVGWIHRSVIRSVPGKPLLDSPRLTVGKVKNEPGLKAPPNQVTLASFQSKEQQPYIEYRGDKEVRNQDQGNP